jgi:serine protease AprX
MRAARRAARIAFSPLAYTAHHQAICLKFLLHSYGMVRKKLQWLLAMLLSCGMYAATAQSDRQSFAIHFTDKNHSPYSLAHPEEFLSPKAIEKRASHGIGYDALDLPVSPYYIEQIEQHCHCTAAYASKWFNAIVVRNADTQTINQLEHLPFVKKIVPLGTATDAGAQRSADKLYIEDATTTSSNYTEGMYGKGADQITMLNGHLLHQLGYDGRGIDIAVIDAGFTLVPELAVFEKLRSESRIKMTRDFAFDQGDDVYDWSSHGTSVLSIIAGDLRDSLIGTAPGANYYLLRTENVLSETLQEEYNWAAAAELCDSLGMDILTTSLGYSAFDDTATNHTYADMDGNTTIITIASDIAAAKGMLVVNSAGNEGDDPWHYITAPADGDSVMAVGAVNAAREHAFFSSYGPSADGRVKPNVSTMGQAAAYAAQDGTIRRGNGTSFSSPVLSGMAACLWQAFPQKSNMEIFRAIEQSAHLYHAPTDALGYGIPDFWKAFRLLQSDTKTMGELAVQVFPNPCVDYLNITLENAPSPTVEYTIYDALGRPVYTDSGILVSEKTGVLKLNLAVRHLAPGAYSLQLRTDGLNEVVRFVKVREER